MSPWRLFKCISVRLSSVDGLIHSSLHQMTIQREKHTIGSRAGQPVHLEKLFSCMFISLTVVPLPSCTIWGVEEAFVSFSSLEKSKMTCPCIFFFV